MWRSLTLAVAVAVIVALLAYLVTAPAEPATLKQAIDGHQIRIGFANEIPYAYLDSQGQLTGEAPETAHRILQKMGITRVEGVLTDFDALIPDLEGGRFDMIAAGMLITPERQNRVRFSVPVLRIGPALLVPKGNPKSLHSYTDLAQKGAIVAVVAGAVERGYAIAAGVNQSSLLAVPDQETGMEAVRVHRADAFASTGPSVAWLVQSEGGATVERALPFSSEIPAIGSLEAMTGFAFRPSDRDLCDTFNAGLKQFLSTPEHEALLAQWGFGPDERISSPDAAVPAAAKESPADARPR
jgi:polar amino acid transport system substrate-binding protein